MTDRDEPSSAGLEPLLALARRSLTGGPPKRNATSLQRVERALTRRARRRRALAGAALVSCAVLSGWCAFFWLRPEAAVALSYQLSQGVADASGELEAAADGTRVSFSDGTQLALAAHGRARVQSLSPHGVDLGLERGRAKLDVVHKPGARWSVHAGPYLVRVTGTSFELEFEPEQRWLKLDLLVGSVSVSGPLIDGALLVRAGQRLLVRPGDALVLVQRREAEANAGDSPAAAPSVEPPMASAATSASSSSPPDDTGPSSAAASTPSASPEDQRPSSAIRHARVHARRSPALEPAATPPLALPSWQQRVAAGRFAEVIALAEAGELARAYREAPLEDLEALADAARYARRSEVARPALLALRERFAGSRAAREAAFLLGRLDERAGATSAALAWYERYLSDDPSGAYASQALGRQLSLTRSELGAERAQALAQEYLRRFPRGPYAASARELSGAR